MVKRVGKMYHLLTEMTSPANVSGVLETAKACVALVEKTRATMERWHAPESIMSLMAPVKVLTDLFCLKRKEGR